MPVYVEVIRRGWLLRQIRLSGDISAVVEYSGRGMGYESVRVNGIPVAESASFAWFTPRFDFELETPHGKLPTALEVRVAPWLDISGLQVAVAGVLVYAEGSFGQLKGDGVAPALPIPASGGTGERKLPIPATTGTVHSAQLPVVSDD